MRRRMSLRGTMVGLHGVGVQTTRSTPVSRRDAPRRVRSRSDTGSCPPARCDAHSTEENVS